MNENKALFVLDKGSSEVVKLDSSGTALKKIGGTGWDDYTFDDPADICVSVLKVYITDRNNNRVQVYDKDLNFLFSLDPKNFIQPKSVFKYPVSSQASKQGDLFIADSDNKQILKFNSNWEYVNSFAGYEYGKFAMADPVRLAVDENSNVYLLDGKKILVFDQYGNGLTVFPLPEKPSGLKIAGGIITVIYDSYLLVSRPGAASSEIPRFERITPGIKEKIVDAMAMEKRIYVLTENSLFTLSLE